MVLSAGTIIFYHLHLKLLYIEEKDAGITYSRVEQSALTFRLRFMLSATLVQIVITWMEKKFKKF